MSTVVPSGKDVQRNWIVIDAGENVLGRIATEAARILMCKHKPTYTPYLDQGDHVIIVNAGKVRLTGKKEEQKVYRYHSGYPGGLREVGAARMRAVRPAKMVEEAVKGMLPKTKLGKQMYRKLKVYAGEHHPHAAQQPKALAQ
jgi:large subunit ribosomal protein L13